MADTLRELTALLKQQRALLVRGEFAALGELSIRIQDLADRLTPAAPIDDLRRIKSLASGNAPLIIAALRGIQAARKRLADITGPTPATATYAADGSPVSYGRDSVAFEKRL